jgi:hypothetical protein
VIAAMLSAIRNSIERSLFFFRIDSKPYNRSHAAIAL